MALLCECGAVLKGCHAESPDGRCRECRVLKEWARGVLKSYKRTLLHTYTSHFQPVLEAPPAILTRKMLEDAYPNLPKGSLRIVASPYIPRGTGYLVPRGHADWVKIEHILVNNEDWAELTRKNDQ